MYLKSKDLTLVLIFDTLEHFRCFSGHGGARASGDGRHDRPPAHAEPDGGAAAGELLCAVFRRSHGWRLSAGGLRRALVCRNDAGHGRPHQRSVREPCGRAEGPLNL